jgi:glutathione S-transferase
VCDGGVSRSRAAGIGYQQDAASRTLIASHKEPRMITLFDYLPSQNAWKVRLLLHHLGRAYKTVQMSIFEGAGRTPEFLRLNPAGKVPVIQLEDGRSISESNAILSFLADGTPYLPSDAYLRAKVHQWLSFEQEHVEMTIGSLRYWSMTGKLSRRDLNLVNGKRAAALRSLAILDDHLATNTFVAGEQYTVADIAIFAYGSRAEEAGLPLSEFRHFRAWIERVESQPGFLGTVYPYSMDPHSEKELR